MQRDMDYVRDLLLKIEGASADIDSSDLLDAKATKDEVDKLNYHLVLLIDEAGFAKGIDAHSMQGKHWLSVSLTWKGHEFLDTIRDPDIWRETKAGAKKVGSSAVEFLWELAKGYAKQLAKKELGIDI
jgi:hypothetical protein